MKKQFKLFLVISILLNAILIYQFIENKRNLESDELLGQVYLYNSINNLNDNLKSVSNTLELYGEPLTEKELQFFNRAIENIKDTRSNVVAAMTFTQLNFSTYYENYLLSIERLLGDIVEGNPFHKRDIDEVIVSLNSTIQTINDLFSQGNGIEEIASELTVKRIYGDLERVNKQIELVYRK